MQARDRKIEKEKDRQSETDRDSERHTDRERTLNRWTKLFTALATRKSLSDIITVPMKTPVCI